MPPKILHLKFFSVIQPFSFRLNRAFSLTWSTSMQIYWKKRTFLNKKRVQLSQDWFGTPIWPPWRHVKTLYSDPELMQRRQRRQRGRQKSNRLRLAKQQLCTCITLFCTFLCRHCTTTTWNFLISRFLEKVNSRQRLLFLFLNIDTVF